MKEVKKFVIMNVLDLTLSVITLVLFLICFVKYKFSYWRNLGVPFLEPKFPYGNMQGKFCRYNLMLHTVIKCFISDLNKKLNPSFFFSRIYNELKAQGGKFGGYYQSTKPVALITDLELLKYVLVKDFQYFHDREMYYNLKDDPLSGHLFNVDGEYWKKMREKLTPTFTSGKLRSMVPTIVEVANRFEALITEKIQINSEMEFHGFLSRFICDVIGSVAFGINCNALEDENTEFVRMASQIFKARNNFFQRLILSSFPKIARMFRMKITRDDATSFYMKTITDVVDYRKKSGVKRNDFIDLLTEVKHDGELNDGRNDRVGKLSMGQIAAQSFIFFIAVSFMKFYLVNFQTEIYFQGFDSSSSTMAFCLYEMIMNQEIQDKARKDVQDALARHDGEITYESLHEMTYLDKCIKGEFNESAEKQNFIFCDHFRDLAQISNCSSFDSLCNQRL